MDAIAVCGRVVLAAGLACSLLTASVAWRFYELRQDAIGRPRCVGISARVRKLATL